MSFLQDPAIVSVSDISIGLEFEKDLSLHSTGTALISSGTSLQTVSDLCGRSSSAIVTWSTELLGGFLCRHNLKIAFKT